MATWTYSFLPIKKVLLKGGEVEFGELARILSEAEPVRFKDMKQVDWALKRYIACLNFTESGRVTFNRNAGTYTRMPRVYERSVQFALHEAVPNMEHWQLYPIKTKLNSPTCFIGVPWGKLPQEHDGRGEPYIEDCDFRAYGKDECRTGCGVSEQVLRGLGLI